MNYNQLALSILDDSFDNDFLILFGNTINWLFEYDDLIDNGYDIDINGTINTINEFNLNDINELDRYINIDRKLLLIISEINNRFDNSRLIIDNILSYLYSVIQEKEYIKNNKFDLGEFLYIKKYNSGFNIVLFMILNERNIYTKDNHLIFDFYCAYISLLNDIFSYDKEKMIESNPFNFISLLITYYNFSYEQALKFSKDIIKYCINNIESYRSSPILEKICSYADRIIDGYSLWAMQNRYQ